ncbi:ATP-dependent sacrificial sulfur transferase LarE [Vagococcus lutrae]|uniref:ATP-dependent sacrificial sulfur transferase LarE n=1 Tax=Vagococcus lutrae TaxID=81947 RepID=UPI000F86F231|nr:ATP-dependent sacrificial sulfur transferase LarE [Vagococcus lutrae]RST91263.1 TIGR00268 family protein [Vagococcus lutrae]UQF23156.1 ATP-dependent sacrificial sulfur transferase LarE [Vagococcus lutrae]UQF64760.1 ATP-dependent sacrificial sulfur transferase LarE [Vagococcus lutrae]
MLTLSEKHNELTETLKSLEKVSIAFSGGIDSTLTLKLALDTLGKENVLAVIINSDLVADDEYLQARVLAENLGAQSVTVAISELANEEIAANGPDSWYHSKKLMYQSIKNVSHERGFLTVLDGMIMDDLSDFRPGLKARTEEEIRSLLQEHKFYKSDVRELAKQLDLPVWNKASSCSVASRFPYGTRLTKEDVEMVFKSEKYLRELGLSPVRVRVHGKLARIEISEKDLLKTLKFRDIINGKLENIGFQYVTLDCRSYQTGRMNEVLTEKEKEPFV